MDGLTGADRRRAAGELEAQVMAALWAALDTAGDREQVLRQFAATLDDTEARLLCSVLADRYEEALTRFAT